MLKLSGTQATSARCPTFLYDSCLIINNYNVGGTYFYFVLWHCESMEGMARNRPEPVKVEAPKREYKFNVSQ